MAASTRARVVIVGAGFGGLECARKVNRAATDVLLLDRGGYHLSTPLLYQVATALLNPSEIAYPLRAMFRRSPNVWALTTTVTGVDFSRRVVHASPGEEIPYDYLVLATGSTNNYHGNEQLAENSIGLKTLEDGTHLRSHVLGCLERADQETDPDERRALLTFISWISDRAVMNCSAVTVAPGTGSHCSPSSSILTAETVDPTPNPATWYRQTATPNHRPDIWGGGSLSPFGT